MLSASMKLLRIAGLALLPVFAHADSMTTPDDACVTNAPCITFTAGREDDLSITDITQDGNLPTLTDLNTPAVYYNGTGHHIVLFKFTVSAVTPAQPALSGDGDDYFTVCGPANSDCASMPPTTTFIAFREPGPTGDYGGIPNGRHSP